MATTNIQLLCPVDGDLVPGAASTSEQGRRLQSQRARTWVASFIAVGAAIFVPLIVGLRVDYSSFLSLLGLPLALIPCGFYLHRRALSDLLGAVEGVALVIVLAVPILILSYAAMRLNLPLADARLAGWDDALGLNAMTVVKNVGNSPWLASGLGISYSSFSLQLLAIPPLLMLTGQTARGYWFVEAFLIGCIVSIAISAFFPALGSYVHFALDAKAAGAVNPFFGYHFLESFDAVRGDPNFVLSLGAASGIVTFPSIHAATAVFCGYAAWSARALRIPFLVLNIAMFASAITHGAHYFVDVAAGGIVALLVILLRGPASAGCEVALAGCRTDTA